MSYKFLLSIFLLSLVTINSEHVKNGEKWFRSNIFIGADDGLVSITLNDNEVYFPTLLNNWLTVQTLDLPSGAAFTSSNGKKVVTLELTWTNDDTNNADDSTMGYAAPTITIPVTLTAQQHI